MLVGSYMGLSYAPVGMQQDRRGAAEGGGMEGQRPLRGLVQ
jgi:hypothetical protein